MNVDINPKIRISVITMTFNRPATVRKCLDSLVSQSIESDCFEVILVDVSDQPVYDVVQAFTGQLNIRHLPASNQGVAGNRNYGARHARGRWLAWIDDDCIADPGWLECLLTAAEGNPADLVGGSVKNLHPGNALACAGQVITEAVDACFNPGSGEPSFFPGLNFTVPRERYLSIGGCDEGFGRLAAEDRDFMDRWRSSGGRLVKAADAIVFHSHRTDFGGFIRQYFNYGRGSWRYHALRRSRGAAGFSESLKLHQGLIRYARQSMDNLSTGMRVKVILLLAAWELANAAGFAWQAGTELIGRLFKRGKP